MSKAVRFLAVLAGFAIIAVIGFQGPAWASRLGIGGPVAPADTSSGQAVPTSGPVPQSLAAAGAPDLGLPEAPRPQGTVPLPPPTVTITPGSKAIVGNCATAFMTSAPAGVVYTATLIDQTLLPGPFPGTLASCGIRIDAQPVSATLGAEIQVCFPIPPTATALAYHHDQQQWVQTTAAVQNGESCVTVPVGDPNPTFSALFEQ